MIRRDVSSFATRHRHRCVALVRFRDECRSRKFSARSSRREATRLSIVPTSASLDTSSAAGVDMLEPPAQLQPSLTVDGITINVPSLPEAVSSIVSAAQHGDNFSVCTLNLDHVVQLQHHANFRAAYRRARFVTADGFPIVVLSRLMGVRIERTTGADLVEPVCAEARKKGLPVFLLGANDLTLKLTARRLSERFKGLQIAGCFAPGPGFDPYSSEADAAIERIRASGARLCFVALGAPRQELFAARCLDELDGTGVLCIGAALDFIAGTQSRAPSIARRTGLEWAWRMLREPRRLGPRYIKCMTIVPRLVARTIPQIVQARMRKAA
ncbi:WecB/TagA/CpsF family glycosyltransferase [Bradyrhizobium sp. sBnM-33]|uniref:WecB/TagA/CpsF family glycosyltransferase n=1 Tax=Bradyrhizobium sp. sBnM-33 TaxID=2831780 RepID=UPI0020C1719D|nr:WecB/TagA/CpsF family glycosyltransferase [Bradyrhizobium sp. sBnM-33]WOH49988.1 WecB/TagA/CpsF family glycosyltransferase [Bradyrhizobium sp. sBnM-33]